MKHTPDSNLDNETIRMVGLNISEKHINAQTAPDSRVFDYPHLDNVFVMESDLYGNTMPKGSCFLAFNGKHGLIGKHLFVETLLSASVADIKLIVDNNTEH